MQLKEFFEKSKRGKMERLSEAVGVAQPVVSLWTHGKRKVPAEHCPEIENFTEGKVTCEELRPDVNWSILRNSSK